jgi:hypothetical protein
MKILTILFAAVSLCAGIWAVDQTVKLMHAAANVMQIAQSR